MFYLLIMPGIDILSFDSQHKVCLVTFNIMIFRTFVQVLIHFKSNNVEPICDKMS